MNSKTLAGLVTAALVAAPLAANAASVTYDFTGTVVAPAQGETSAATVGTAVSGTITIDLANATSTTGSESGTSNFSASESGSPNYVFSDTVTAGSFSYATASPGPNTSTDSVAGSNSGNTYVGFEQQNALTSGSDSKITLAGSSAVYNNGLPLTFTSAPAGSFAGFATVYGPQSDTGIDYTITSLTLASTVPLPAAAWLMFSGLAGLVFVARRRKEGTGFAATT